MAVTRKHRLVWPPVSPGFWAVAALAAAIVCVCTVNSLAWIDRPFPGFLLWENLFVPAIGDTDWTGYEAGLPYQSRLITVNGRAVSSAAEVYRLAASLPAGSEVTYAFSPGPSHPAVTVTVPTMPFVLAEYLWTMGNYLAVGSLLVALGSIVYRVRPDAPAALALLMAGMTWGLYLVTSADIFGPAWFRPLCLVLQAIGPVALLHLALTFPVERDVLARHPRLLGALYLVGLGVGLADNLVFRSWFEAVLFIDRLNSVALVLSGVVLIGLLAHTFFVPPSAAARQRIKIVALGGFPAFVLPVTGFFLFYLMGVSFPLNFLTFTAVLFPIAVGYAIVKHDLFEVDAIIRRAVAWTILTGLIAALYLGGVGTMELLLTRRGGRVAGLLLLLTVVVLFNRLRDRVQAAVDYLFARDHYDYRKTVTEASQELASLLDLETVVARILRIIAETIHVEFGAVWLRDDDQEYRLQALTGVEPPAGVPERLDGGCALLDRLEGDPQSIVSEDQTAERDGRLAREIARLGATLLVPMTFEQRLAGFLALGAKQSGGFYSREDLELLRTLANQGAVAVANARSYRALVRANEELRAAQSRLIEAERFAAIGELSAAVAHGIRNPLAGIKAAAQFASLELAPDHPLHENITDIIGEADKLEARIKELLDFAKPFEPHWAPCRVASIVADAVASLRSQITLQSIALTIAVDPALPEAQLDYAQIEQVLLVLLCNALEAMAPGGRLEITAGLTQDATRVHITVADSGQGIATDQLPRLFELFHTTKPSGTGLGLVVARKIVERHGGRIAVTSEIGRGSRFTVELPLTPA